LSPVQATGPAARHAWQAPLWLQKSVPQHSCVASQLHAVDAQQDWSAAHWPLQQAPHCPSTDPAGRKEPVAKQPSAPQ
jgi:hypothetical protein